MNNGSTRFSEGVCVVAAAAAAAAAADLISKYLK